ncbi:MAG: hypothetical protein CO133_01885, partial [Candidatus Komeilibacteria bacterium CG_4_9_14_3_um_filter_37_5]
AAATIGVGRREEPAPSPGQHPQQMLQRPGETHGTSPQCCHPHLIEEGEGSAEWRQGQHRRIAELPAVGPDHRDEPVRHVEAGPGIVAPPSGEPRHSIVAVPLMHEASADGTGARVQVFVRTPDR